MVTTSNRPTKASLVDTCIEQLQNWAFNISGVYAILLYLLYYDILLRETRERLLDACLYVFVDDNAL